MDSLNECDSNPCQHPDATCQDKLGEYACYCPPQHTGKNCEIYDRKAPAGLGRTIKVNEVSRLEEMVNSSLEVLLVSPINQRFIQDLENRRQECIANKCPSKRGNRQCDEDCNSYACDFDGNDCSLGNQFLSHSVLKDSMVVCFWYRN